MAELVFLALSREELDVLKRPGKVIVGNFNNVPVAEPEPTKGQFAVLAAVFSRVMAMGSEGNQVIRFMPCLLQHLKVRVERLLNSRVLYSELVEPFCNDEQRSRPVLEICLELPPVIDH